MNRTLRQTPRTTFLGFLGRSVLLGKQAVDSRMGIYKMSSSVYLQIERHLPRQTVEPGPDGGHRLGQNHACPAVQVSERLVVPCVHRHAHSHPAGLQLHVLDSEILVQAVLLL